MYSIKRHVSASSNTLLNLGIQTARMMKYSTLSTYLVTKTISVLHLTSTRRFFSMTLVLIVKKAQRMIPALMKILNLIVSQDKVNVLHQRLLFKKPVDVDLLKKTFAISIVKTFVRIFQCRTLTKSVNASHRRPSTLLPSMGLVKTVSKVTRMIQALMQIPHLTESLAKSSVTLEIFSRLKLVLVDHQLKISVT